MKIAFVGKGGSGKTTISGLFINYLVSKDKNILAVDADINMHLNSIIGAKVDSNLGLSKTENAIKIKEFLKGNNYRVKEAINIVKTTPPSRESNFVEITDENYIIKNFSAQFSQNGYYLHVGTYECEGIGESCYHSDLAIYESLVSHTLTDENHCLVTDMVAGTDAFAGSLHAQFDVIIVVIEPTPEGTSVWNQYEKLSKEAGILNYVYAIGNKVEDSYDIEYLKESIGPKLLGYIESNKNIKRSRQLGKKLDSKLVISNENLFNDIYEVALTNSLQADERLKLLHKLHIKHASADYIINRHGDIKDQIDLSFSYLNIKRNA